MSCTLTKTTIIWYYIGGEETFKSVDSLDGLLNSMASGGPLAMETCSSTEPKLDAQMLGKFKKKLYST